MEVKAVGKYIKVQPRKVRIVADEIRGKSAVYSAHLLRFHPSKSARLLRKVLVSAIATR
jgi:large subunit ribosomal protein L22